MHLRIKWHLISTPLISQPPLLTDNALDRSLFAKVLVTKQGEKDVCVASIHLETKATVCA